ncbi:MAG TPA: hypothetical protein VMR02_17750 [Terracidiphilus sp.]|nr:hypothetical protein [Terracidiphilus sp.]
MGAFLFGVSGANPFIYISSMGCMIAMALLASALPAIRAASSDPIECSRAI